MNFNAGPAALPRSVLERARDEMLDFEGSGMSIMEHSHRGKVYEAVHREAVSLLRTLLGVPDSYAVLLLQGGAHQAFAQVPMNFLAQGHTADYLVTGHWGERAYDEACNVGSARLAGPDLSGGYTRIPASDENALSANAAYVHITTNNTIEGTQYDTWPDTSRVPLVADMCSDFLWRPFDVTRFGVVYAGAQKNLGPAGVTIYLIRRELLDRAQTNIPKVFRFGVHEANESLYNTPPTFAIYMVRNMLQWMRDEGGLGVMEQRNRSKSAWVYGAIDAHPGFYRCPVEPASRSHMNVVFRLPDEALETQFVAEATRADMVGLKGHRSVGGIRASLYNAVTPDDARALASFMHDFVKKNG